MSAAAASQRATRRTARLVTAAADKPSVVVQEQPCAKRQRKTVAAAAEALALDGATVPEAAAEAAAAPKAKAKAAGPTRELEEELWQQGFARVAGVDEAGRGPLAGPVVAAACVVPQHVTIVGIDDSKKLNEAQREALYAQLTTHPDVQWAAKVVEADEIDTINILQAAMKAMEDAAAALPLPPDFLLIDGNRLPKGVDPERARPIVKGDAKSTCIAAASVIAKVTRDRLMHQLHEQYPLYNFAGHKGYCVPEHVEAIRRHGPCPQHRRTFAPVKTWYPLEPAEGEAAGQQQKAANKGSGGGRKKRS